VNVLRFPLVLATALVREAPFIHPGSTSESPYNTVSIQSKLAEKSISHLRERWSPNPHGTIPSGSLRAK
jgi:hypothetical protein